MNLKIKNTLQDKYKSSLYIILSIFLISFSNPIRAVTDGVKQKKEHSYNADNNEFEINFIKKKPAFLVTKPITNLEKQILNRLSTYMGAVLEQSVKIVPSLKKVKGDYPIIILSVAPDLINSESKEAYAIETKMIDDKKVIAVTGKTEQGLKRAVYRLILESKQTKTTLSFPAMNILESPWITQREWALCPWSPDIVRLNFFNPDVDKRVDVYKYSEKQIEDYVAMFDWFGFNGCQLMETCANYAAFGSPEGFRSKQFQFAKSIKSLGQHLTHWVWAAKFNNYGWYDKTVVYKPEKNHTAFTDPRVKATFEKYYDGYSQMAPYVDMLIAHFYDPGELTNREDVFKYLELLNSKYKAKNPNIKFGIDFWATGDSEQFMQELINKGFQDALFLEMSIPFIYKEGQREALHEAAKREKIRLGMWGWYMTEYETDQMPKMHVNAQLLKNFYQDIKKNVFDIHPLEYWSEMEAYHILNIFSMYASAQLLWNPDRNTDDILSEISEAIYGTENGQKMLQVLKLIEDVRSGPTWDTYWWTSKEYRLGTEDPSKDLLRAISALKNLQEMKIDENYITKLPMPISPAELAEMIIPHIKQIKAFAEFRLKEKEIRKFAANNAPKEQLTQMVQEAWQPILEYDTWIGTWGQQEAKIQEKMIGQLIDDFQLQITEPQWVQYRNAYRYLQRLRVEQKLKKEMYTFTIDGCGTTYGDFMWSKERAQNYMKLLIQWGAIKTIDENKYVLPNWEDYVNK